MIAARSRRMAVVLVVLLAVAGSALFALRNLGRWLELNEPLKPSAAIVVLGGGLPYRAMEAADLYRAGWAKEVWLTQGQESVDRNRVMAQVGLNVTPEYEDNREVLEKLGVPEPAILVVPGIVDNTLTELQAILRFAQSRPPGAVILVSSQAHTRRLRVIWNRIASQDRVATKTRIAIVRYAEADPFDGDAWWRTTSDAQIAFRELFGIANAWMGFPISPREQR